MTKIEEYAESTGFLKIRDDLRKFGSLVITTNLKFFRLNFNSVSGLLSIEQNPLLAIKDNERALFISEFEKICKAKDDLEKILFTNRNE